MKAKRASDLLFAAAGLTILAPFLALVAVVIVLADGGPAFYRQVRVGLNGRPFRMWKFRTMVPGADRSGRLVTVAGDSRITPVGRRLRALKLDELPQLFNVLSGEMSLVGPRPEVERYVAMYSEAQRAVLRLKPGITDPASIRYRNESELLAGAADPEAMYVQSVMPDKIRVNLEYAARATLWTDLRVMLATAIPFVNYRLEPDARVHQ